MFSLVVLFLRFCPRSSGSTAHSVKEYPTAINRDKKQQEEPIIHPTAQIQIQTWSRVMLGRAKGLHITQLLLERKTNDCNPSFTGPGLLRIYSLGNWMITARDMGLKKDNQIISCGFVK